MLNPMGEFKSVFLHFLFIYMTLIIISLILLIPN